MWFVVCVWIVGNAVASFSPVVPAKAGTHSHRGKFCEDYSFGTKTAHIRQVPRYGSRLSPGRLCGGDKSSTAPPSPQSRASLPLPHLLMQPPASANRGRE
jgi:hypothetical protein